MRKFNGREWKAILILSIVAPVALLATFRITGILEGPATIAETITLDVAGWEFERPSCIVHFGEGIESSYLGDVSINQTVFVDDYWPDAGEYGGSPILETGLNLTADLAKGYVENVNITFYDDYLNSFVCVPNLSWKGQTSTVWDNLTITSYMEDLKGIAGVEKAFVNLKGDNQPRRVYLCIWPKWILRSPHNQTQQLNVNVELTYFNGTAYKKVVQPFQLKLIAEDNNSFENAEEASLGQSYRNVLGGDDTQDFYKVYLLKDEIVNITMTPPGGQDFDLYLYSPIDKENPVANSTNSADVVESINYNADFTGWWFVEVRWSAGLGIYTFAIATLPAEGST